MQSSKVKYLARVSTLLLTVSLLGGCSVTADQVSSVEKMNNASMFLKAAYAEKEVNGLLTIDEAVAYAIKHNLDVRVQRMEEDLADNQLLQTKLNMLPKINFEGNAYSRSNETGASSKEISTGIQNLKFSRSSEDDTTNNRLSISYNILDYGMNFIRAKQDASRIEIARERRKAAINGIVRDARVTYMQAALAQKIENDVSGLIVKAQGALANSKEAYNKQLGAPLDNLAYQRDLLLVIQNLKKLQTDLATAKIQLAKLLNIRMGEKFNLIIPEFEKETPVKVVRPDLEQLEVFAVVNRPELAEEDQNLMIEKLERRRVWWNMLPIIEPKLTYNHDSNKFLLNSSWTDFSARIAYSLLQPLMLPSQLDNADDRIEYVSLRRDAMTVSVLSQVNMAYIQHVTAIDQLNSSVELASVEGKISGQINNAVTASSMSEQDAVLGQVKYLLARVERDLDYIEVDRSTSQLLTAVGYNPVPENIDSYKTSELAQLIGKAGSDILVDAAKIDAGGAYSFDNYKKERNQMAFNASYSTKSARPWFIKTGPFKTQNDVKKGTQDMTRAIMTLGAEKADFMPPVPHARLDDGDLGGYYLAYDTLNGMTPEQVCKAMVDYSIACTINTGTAETPDEPIKEEKSNGWNFFGLFGGDKEKPEANPVEQAAVVPVIRETVTDGSQFADAPQRRDLSMPPSMFEKPAMPSVAEAAKALLGMSQEPQAETEAVKSASVAEEDIALHIVPPRKPMRELPNMTAYDLLKNAEEAPAEKLVENIAPAAGSTEAVAAE